jgi:hypothetical protein
MDGDKRLYLRIIRLPSLKLFPVSGRVRPGGVWHWSDPVWSRQTQPRRIFIILSPNVFIGAVRFLLDIVRSLCYNRREIQKKGRKPRQVQAWASAGRGLDGVTLGKE